jgi:hypothetical protein
MNPVCEGSGWAFISPHFRNRRANKFLALFKPTPLDRILDVGGLPQFWSGLPIESRITLLNVDPLGEEQKPFVKPNQEFALGDGTKLDYEDGSFDIVLSNSVIEHLGTLDRQVAFASEVRRVGKAYWVQTPAKEFPIEPHYFGAFVHWFPGAVQKRLLRRLTLWGWRARPTAALIAQAVSELRLLTRSAFAKLFSDATIWTERLAGWPKSHVAYKLPVVPEKMSAGARLDGARSISVLAGMEAAHSRATSRAPR